MLEIWGLSVRPMGAFLKELLWVQITLYFFEVEKAHEMHMHNATSLGNLMPLPHMTLPNNQSLS